MDGSDAEEGGDEEDITLQQTRPDVEPGPGGSQRLRPYRMQKYHRATVARPTSGVLVLPPSQTEQPTLLRASSDGERVTGQLALAVQKLEPLAASGAKRWRELYVWLVLVVLFLLVVLGGIGLDTLLAAYR
ncbi:MAG TPA: hypothetical protein VGT82_15785 [Ktedonobacteraceae bacterium]|nr:hypothetical protein [Ktedonobacteraceae bacterium]